MRNPMNKSTNISLKRIHQKEITKRQESASQVIKQK